MGNSYYEKTNNYMTAGHATDGLGDPFPGHPVDLKAAPEPSMVADMRRQRERLIARRDFTVQRIELLGQLLSLFEEV